MGSSINDEEYVAAGAKILPTTDETWEVADLVLKVLNKKVTAIAYETVQWDCPRFG